MPGSERWCGEGWGNWLRWASSPRRGACRCRPGATASLACPCCRSIGSARPASWCCYSPPRSGECRPGRSWRRSGFEAHPTAECSRISIRKTYRGCEMPTVSAVFGSGECVAWRRTATYPRLNIASASRAATCGEKRMSTCVRRCGDATARRRRRGRDRQMEDRSHHAMDTVV